MQVPLLDLKKQYEAIRREVMETVGEIFESQQFILGPRVESLENAIAEYCGTPHAVGVSSGSSALLISLMAAGIGAGDIVVTSAYTFFATAGAVVRVGAVPLFVDIEADSYNLSPDELEKVLSALPAGRRRSVKAVIPVHLYGQCAEMDPILETCRHYGLVVVEDAAQAIGAEYRGRRAGSMGDFGCFSFFPSKNLGAFGDGGMVTTASEAMCDRLKILRGHGANPKYYHKLVGGNFRLDALQAAIVEIKLKYLDRWTAARQRNAALYRQYFTDSALTDVVTLPAEKQTRHIYNQFVIRVPQKRDELRTWLRQEGIGTEVYYPVPLHRQECFAGMGVTATPLPEAEAAAACSLALPIYPELTADQLAYVVEKINAFWR
jgi:dTDP-4-amino-4,6-dideoxygalactose transaminase